MFRVHLTHDNYSRPPPLKKKQPPGKRGRKPASGGKGKQRPKHSTKSRPEVEDIIKASLKAIVVNRK